VKLRVKGCILRGKLTLPLPDTCSVWETGAYVFVFGLGSGAASATYLVGLLEVTRNQGEPDTKCLSNS
jgi:hypothetical protein